MKEVELMTVVGMRFVENLAYFGLDSIDLLTTILVVANDY
jgi:hypothetical protein